MPALAEVLLVTNPTSGRGRARAWAEAALAQLEQAGRAARIVSARDAEALQPPAPASAAAPPTER